MAVSILVAIGLGATGGLAYLIELDRLDEQVSRQIDQELGEFSALQGNGVDPDTGRAFADVPSLIRTFLQRNVPNSDELLIGWWDGRPRLGFPRNALIEDEAFVQYVGTRTLPGALGGSWDYESADFGSLRVTVQPVRDSRTEGALVVVTFLDETRAGLRDTMRTYSLVAVALWLLITAIAGWLSGRLLAPLRTLREAAQNVTTSDLSQRIPERGNDDVTVLIRTVNEMLDRLEEGFEGQQRFLDDAGHELKTPLTVLRGHLELLDSGSPEDVADTQALLLDEVDRMGRLVGDLILLAKTRRPDFLNLKRADVDVLVDSILAKVVVLADRDWRDDGSPEIEAILDEQRFTQAMLQLTDNAVKHTKPGDQIGLGGAYADGVLTLWVRDTGPGVDPAHRERIFQRFGRVDVQPDDEGFGLGLSIVDAIAEAHGGSITLTDEHPHGARFTLHLPTDQIGAPWPPS